MAQNHPYAQQFLDLLARTQKAYEQRRKEDYLSSFSDNYFSVILESDWCEDKPALSEKITADITNYELLQMEYVPVQHWFCGETGFALLKYETRLRHRARDMILVDKRRNIISANHLGDGVWTIISKIVVHAENYIDNSMCPVE